MSTGVPYYAVMGQGSAGLGQSLSSSFAGNRSVYDYNLGPARVCVCVYVYVRVHMFALVKVGGGTS